MLLLLNHSGQILTKPFEKNETDPKLSENNEWVATLINQLAEIRSQLESGHGDYGDYELQRHPHRVDDVDEDDDDGVNQRRESERRTQRLKRQIGGLLDNCGCPAGPPGAPGCRLTT